MLDRNCHWPPDSCCNHSYDSRKGDQSHANMAVVAAGPDVWASPGQKSSNQRPPTHHEQTVLLPAPDPLWVGVANWLAVHHGILPFILVLAPFMASDSRCSCESVKKLPREPALNGIQRLHLMAQSLASNIVSLKLTLKFSFANLHFRWE